MLQVDISGDALVLSGSAAGGAGRVALISGSTGLSIYDFAAQDLPIYVEDRGGMAVAHHDFRALVATGVDLILSSSGISQSVLGSHSDDHIAVARASNDTQIFGFDGKDVLKGGLGRDHLNGGQSDDELDGGGGDDRLIGGTGHDTLDGGAGDDRLVPGTGHNLVEGGDGYDVLVLQGTRAEYAYSEVAGIGILTRRGDGPEEVVSFTGIERVKFADQTIEPPTTVSPIVVEANDPSHRFAAIAPVDNATSEINNVQVGRHADLRGVLRLETSLDPQSSANDMRFDLSGPGDIPERFWGAEDGSLHNLGTGADEFVFLTGHDAMVLRGCIQDYVLSATKQWGDHNLCHLDGHGIDGTDTFTSIEELRFGNPTIAFDDDTFLV